MCTVSQERISGFLKKRLDVDGEQNRTAVLLVGGPGSGKSSVKSNILRLLKMDQSNFVNVDPDEILTDLFDNDNTCRGIVNEINDTSFEQALAEGKNIIFDGTGKNFEYYAEDLIKRLRGNDYAVTLCIAHNNVEVALQRVKKRAQLHGRDVPAEYVESVYAILETLIPKYLALDCDYANNIYLYDNSSDNLHLLYSTTCRDGTKQLKCVGRFCSTGGKRYRKSIKKSKRSKRRATMQRKFRF